MVDILNFKTEYDLQEVERCKMISVPPQGAGGGGGTANHHAGLTIDCGGRSKRRNPSGSSGSGSATTPGTTPGSWEEAMSQMSRELHVICHSPDSSTRFSMTSSPTSPKYMSGYSPPSPKMFGQHGPLSPAATQSVSPPSPVTITENVGRPGTPESRATQSINVRHQQTEENLRQKLSSIVCRGLPKRSLSVNESSSSAAAGGPRVVRASNNQDTAASKRKNSGSGFMPHYKEVINVGNRQIEDLHVVIEDRVLKVYADDDDSKGDYTTPSDGGVGSVGDCSAQSSHSRPGDLIKVVTIPDEVVPEKLICIVHNGMLQVRETRSHRGASAGTGGAGGSQGKSKTTPTPVTLDGQRLGGDNNGAGGVGGGVSGNSGALPPLPPTSTLGPSTPSPSPAASAAGGTPGSPRHRSKSDGAQPQPSQQQQQQHGPIVIHDDGSQQLKLVLRIPPGYNMQDLVIKTVDDQLIVSGKKLCTTLYNNSVTTPPPQQQQQQPPLDVETETEMTPSCSFSSFSSTPNAADAQAASTTSASPGPSPSESEFVKVFELPNTVDPYSITAHVTDRCQLVIQAVLSTRCRCGSY